MSPLSSQQIDIEPVQRTVLSRVFWLALAFVAVVGLPRAVDAQGPLASSYGVNAITAAHCPASQPTARANRPVRDECADLALAKDSEEDREGTHSAANASDPANSPREWNRLARLPANRSTRPDRLSLSALPVRGPPRA